MVNFSTKFKELFSKRGGRTGPSPGASSSSSSTPAASATSKNQAEPEVLSSQVHIAGQLYYIRNRPAPYHLMDLSAPGSSSQSTVRLHSRNGSIALYAITEEGAAATPQETPASGKASSTTYEMVLEVPQLQHLEMTLLLTNQAEVATGQLASPVMALLNAFQPYLVECGSRSTALTTVSELLECFSANPAWTVHHFAAYFNWESHFSAKSIPPSELENTSNPGGWSVLHVAVYCAGRPLLEALLASGMDVGLVDARGATVLHYAVKAKAGEEEAAQLVDFLIERPAFYEQLRAVDSDGQTPLHVAFLGGHLGAVRRLLAQGLTAKMLSIGRPEKAKADSQATYIDPSPYVTFSEDELATGLAVDELHLGGSPLHWANDFDLLERLLKLTAFRVNGRNLQGDTPLIAFIRRLAAQEAHSLDSTVVKVSNRSPTAAKKGTKKSGAKTGAGGGTPLKAAGNPQAAAAWRQLALSRPRQHSHYRLSWLLRLLTAGGRVNATNHLTGETALHYAVLAHDIASLQALVIFGARINMRDKAGVSALHLACSQLKSLGEGGGGQENTGLKSSRKKGTKSPRKSGKRGNQCEEARTAAHYKQIVRLLVESGARRCPPLMDNSADKSGGGGGSSAVHQQQPPPQSRVNPQCGPECAHHQGGAWAAKSEAFVKVEIRAVDDHCRLRLVKQGGGSGSGASGGKKAQKGRPSSRKIAQPEPLKKAGSNLNTATSISSSSFAAESAGSPSTSSFQESQLPPTPPPSPRSVDTELTTSESNQTPSTSSIKVNKDQQKPQNSSSSSAVNMIVFDGGDSHSGIRPLIQALILNELENYLPRPLHAYFSVVGGVSFGATAAALFSTRRTAAETFYFFLRLKEAFKAPVLLNMTANGAHLETVLKREFGSEKDDGLRMESVASVYGKHLLLLSTLVDREPVLQNVFSSYRYPPTNTSSSSSQEADPTSNPYLWWACRAASASLYCYATFHGHYDNGLHASNPTMDILAKYEGSRAELKAAAAATLPNSKTPPPKQLPPLNLVLSVGCGSKPVTLNTAIKELGVGPLSFKFLDVPYIMQLRDVCFEVITEQNGFIAERAAVWAGSLGATYGRLAFAFTKPKVAAEEAEAAAKLAAKSKKAKTAARRVPSEGRPDKAYLGKVTAGTLRSAPAAPIVDGDGHLLQTLWAVKLTMLARKSLFVRLARALEQWKVASLAQEEEEEKNKQ